MISTLTQAEKIAKAIATVEAVRDQMMNALDINDRGEIMAWDNGLCVGLNDDGSTFITNPIDAPPAWKVKQRGTVKNRNGDAAWSRRRQDVINQRLQEAWDSLEMFRSMEAAQ